MIDLLVYMAKGFFRVAASRNPSWARRLSDHLRRLVLRNICGPSLQLQQKTIVDYSIQVEIEAFW